MYNCIKGYLATIRFYFSPKRRVRDVVGPSPAAARVERCVNVTDSLMARPNGSSAPATARQYGFQLPLLLKLFCNQSCGHQQVDMLSLLLAGAIETGQAAGEGVLGLARANRPRRHVATRRGAPAKRIASMDVSLDMLPW